MTADPPILEIDRVEKHFTLTPGNRLTGRAPVRLHAVDGVSFAIRPGEAVGLVGESGCGKSTLSRIAARLIAPDAGRIRIGGQDVTDTGLSAFTRSALRREVQMVFQDPTDSLNPRFSVFDLIADPLRQLLPRMSRAALRGRVGAAAAAVNLPAELLERFPHQLSGGQKARVGIARAMSVGPRLLVLDEPTSALDVSIQATVLQLLDRLRREHGVAMLFVSHDLNVVRLLCSRIVVMYLGQVVESGATAQVFAAPRHPYTRALISAIPSLRAGAAGRIELAGEPQSPVNPAPHMCRLYGRCPAQQDRCRTEAPELRPEAGGRMVRCHFPGT